MKKQIEKLLLGRKSRVKGLALGAAIVTPLAITGVHPRIIREICGLFWQRRTFEAVEATLWLLNRSYLRFSSQGLDFEIGAVLSDGARRNLLGSRHIRATANAAYDRCRLILTALERYPDSRFWAEQWHLHAGAYDPAGGQRAGKGRKRGIRERDAVAALEDFDRLYQGLAGDYFLVSGTFLGLVREKGFLGHDYDIDLGCFEADFDPAAFFERVRQSESFYLKEVGYFLKADQKGRGFSVRQKPTVIKLMHASFVTIDLFVHFEAGGEVVHGSSVHLWRNSAFNLADYEFYGRRYLGAADFDRYLGENYGEWRIEKKAFNCDFDTPNLVFPDTPRARIYLLQNYGSTERMKPLSAIPRRPGVEG